MSAVGISSALMVHMNNDLNSTSVPSNHSLPSSFSTLGDRPPSSLLYHSILLLSSTNIDASCKFNLDLTGSLVVFIDHNLPMLQECTTDINGRNVAFAKAAQDKGALGVILGAVEEFQEGRVTSFSPSIFIPYVVVPRSTIDFLTSNLADISALELSAITEEEDQQLTNLTNLYNSWIPINITLYGMLVIILSFTVCIDMYSRYQTRRLLSHSSVMRQIALLDALLVLLWHSVDPFGFRGILWWHSSVLRYLTQGLYMIVLSLILHVWIKAADAKQRFLKIHKHALLRFVDIVAVLIFVVALFYSLFWYIYYVEKLFDYVMVTCLVIFGLGFFTYGNNILRIFKKSGNRNPNSAQLPRKIIIFIISYVIVAYISLIISSVEALGIIFAQLFMNLMGAFLYFATFLFLFFPRLRCPKTKTASQVKLVVPLSILVSGDIKAVVVANQSSTTDSV